VKFVVAPPPSIRAGNVFQLQVEAVLADGQTRDTTFNGAITLTAAAPGGLGFSFPVSVNAAAGLGTVNVFLNDAANGYTITAAASGYASGITPSFNVVPR
jgi:hypothetical protein